jgi:putative SOS response-associated peptidase YedK
MDQILAAFDADETVKIGPPQYDIAPSQQIPVVRHDDVRRTITLPRGEISARLTDWLKCVLLQR